MLTFNSVSVASRTLIRDPGRKGELSGEGFIISEMTTEAKIIIISEEQYFLFLINYNIRNNISYF